MEKSINESIRESIREYKRDEARKAYPDTPISGDGMEPLERMPKAPDVLKKLQSISESTEPDTDFENIVQKAIEIIMASPKTPHETVNRITFKLREKLNQTILSQTAETTKLIDYVRQLNKTQP